MMAQLMGLPSSNSFLCVLLLLLFSPHFGPFPFHTGFFCFAMILPFFKIPLSVFLPPCSPMPPAHFFLTSTHTLPLSPTSLSLELSLSPHPPLFNNQLLITFLSFLSYFCGSKWFRQSVPFCICSVVNIALFFF